MSQGAVRDRFPGGGVYSTFLETMNITIRSSCRLVPFVCFFLCIGPAPAEQNDGQPSVDLLNLADGAVVLSQSSQFNEKWAALLLLDDTAEQGWCTAEGAAFPHQVVIELDRTSQLTSIVFDNSNAQEDSYPGISARRIEVAVSSESSAGPFSEVLEVEAEKGKKSEFEFPNGTQARWLRISVLSNWGNDGYTELMELEAYGRQLEEEASEVRVSGVYRTNFGLVLFAQEGSSISGCYDWDQGALTGNLDGRVIQFEWRENEGQQIGTALMVLSSTGDQLNGLWYEKGACRGFWVGSRAAPGERPSCQLQHEGSLQKSLRESGRAIVYGIHFDLDSDRLRSDSEATLQEVLNVMEQQPELALIVEGHTDSTGDAAYNQDLSRRRARSVVAWLVEQGIDSGRLEPQGYGEDRPVAGNETAQGRALNRRVELKRKP